MKTFGLINEIIFDAPESWQNKIFLTLDIDWASDEVIEYVANILIEKNIKATWFVTHDSPYINKLKENSLFELGIHPNFNPLLLKGSFEKGANAEEILDRVIQIVPNATAVRCHSLTQNSSLVSLFVNKKLLHELNVLIPIQSQIEVKPYKNCLGIVELPHIWEDDVHMSFSESYQEIIEKIKIQNGLVILDFHPIHIFLNETNFEHYNSLKHNLNNFEYLKSNRNETEFGTFDFLKELIKLKN
jgi:hypothetical protein